VDLPAVRGGQTGMPAALGGRPGGLSGVPAGAAQLNLAPAYQCLALRTPACR
jgi:hypothetical protein